eukprot:gene24570-biopygen7404
MFLPRGQPVPRHAKCTCKLPSRYWERWCITCMAQRLSAAPWETWWARPSVGMQGVWQWMCWRCYAPLPRPLYWHGAGQIHVHPADPWAKYRVRVEAGSTGRNGSGRGPDADRTIECKGTDAGRTRAAPFLSASRGGGPLHAARSRRTTSATRQRTAFPIIVLLSSTTIRQFDHLTLESLTVRQAPSTVRPFSPIVKWIGIEVSKWRTERPRMMTSPSCIDLRSERSILQSILVLKCVRSDYNPQPAEGQNPPRMTRRCVYTLSLLGGSASIRNLRQAPISIQRVQLG